MAVRVFQIAKDYSRTPKEVIDVLRDAGIEVASKTSTLDEHALHTLRAKFGKFKLTVVDGDQESSVPRQVEETAESTAPPPKPKKAGKKTSKKKASEPDEPPRPRLAVRVIKKHEEAEEAQAQDSEPQSETAVPTEEAAKPRLRPKLKKSVQMRSKIQERINKIAEQRGQKPTDIAEPRTSAAGSRDTARSPKRKRVEMPLVGQETKIPPNQVGAWTTLPAGRKPAGAGGGAGRPGQSTQVLRDMAPMKGPAAGDKGKHGRSSRFGPVRPGGKKKKRKKKNVEQIEKIRPVTLSKVELPEEDLGIIMLSEGVTVKELSEKVNRKAKDVIKRLFEKGILATLNDVLDSELAIEIAKDFGYLAEIVSFEEDLQIQEDDLIVGQETEEGTLEPRAPIVTIMGHVDHGKTTLLDAIRATKVASGEAGGITQHIGAYSVPCKDKNIVFLDTPGHEAFTKMRARGASVTDIVILVVAADDGVKPQTVEAISHAKAAKVPIITCINKIDKPEANPDRVKQMLTEHELVVEEFGGDSPCVQVSAKTQEGINDLLEMILLVAELNDYRANAKRKARGTVIEAKLDRGRGPVATIIVQDGTVNVGDYFITGQTYGKIRAMHDDEGNIIKQAPPSTPVEILGIQEVPSAGDSFQVTQDESDARRISSFRKEKAREDQLVRQKHTSLDQLFSSLKQTEIEELSVIVKADVQGSVEGLVFALNKIESEKVHLRIVHQGVGNITENDVLLAVTADAIIIGFNVKPEPKAAELADQEGIDVRLYSVIYEVVKEIQAAMLGLVAPTMEEREIGKAVVKQVFSVSRLGKVAGCMVESGFVRKDAKVQLLRDGEVIHTGKLQTLKRFKDDVNEVKSGYECGIGIQGWSDIQEGDALVFITYEKVEATQL